MADQHRNFRKIVARAWSDETFKAKLLSDPVTALREAGVEVPDGLTVTVVEDTDTMIHLVLPTPPEEDMDDADLDKVAAGVGGFMV